jgi:hypothetical protein
MLAQADPWVVSNAIATWFSAIGTIAAVVVALFLASRDKPKMRVNASFMVILPSREHVFCIVGTNCGTLPVHVQNSFIRFGHKKTGATYVCFPPYHPLSDQFPFVASHGEQRRLMLSKDAMKANFEFIFADLKEKKKLSPWFVRKIQFGFTTSVESFLEPIDSNGMATIMSWLDEFHSLENSG